MEPKLKDAHNHMLQLGLGALRHANWQSSCYAMDSSKIRNVSNQISPVSFRTLF